MDQKRVAEIKREFLHQWYAVTALSTVFFGSFLLDFLPKQGLDRWGCPKNGTSCRLDRLSEYQAAGKITKELSHDIIEELSKQIEMSSRGSEANAALIQVRIDIARGLGVDKEYPVEFDALIIDFNSKFVGARLLEEPADNFQ